jgi:hypothetical protein
VVVEDEELVMTDEELEMLEADNGREEAEMLEAEVLEAEMLEALLRTESNVRYLSCKSPLTRTGTRH